MVDNLSVNKTELSEAFLDSFLASLKEDLENEKQFLSDCDQLYLDYMKRIRRVESKNDRSKYINETDWLKKSLYKLLEDEFPEKREIPFEEEFEKFINSADNYLLDCPFQIKQEQKKERFYPQKEDSSDVVFRKFFKRQLFHLSRAPRYFANIFREQKKEIHYWSHSVPMRSMVEFYFINALTVENLYAFEELMKAKCHHLNLNWNILKQINSIITEFLNEDEQTAPEMISKLEKLEEKDSLTQSQKDLDEAFSKWEKKGAEIFDKLEAQFKDSLPKVDTLELSAGNYSINSLREGRKKYMTKYRTIFGGWKNSIFAQLDDIQIDIELYHIKYFGLMQYFLLRNSAQTRIEKTITQHFDPIEKHFDELLQKLKDTDKDKIAKLIISEKTELSNQLEREIIPKTIEAIYDQDFPNLLDRMEFKIGRAVGEMKEERIIYAENDYDSPINRSELSQFNPRELVQVSILKNFGNDIAKLKASVVEQLESLQNELGELSGIIGYNLESALNSEADEEEDSDIKDIACEGISRTKAKTDTIKKRLTTLQETFNQDLKKAVDELSKALVKLTVNENITDLRLKLATAKAVNKTSSIRDRIWGSFQFHSPKVIKQLKDSYQELKKKGDELLLQLGLKPQSKKLTAELSDFLIKTDEAITKLPYVYKRLYKITPLAEEIFFEGRDVELRQLTLAYQRWKNNNYEATVVIGEKGSGTSSLINFFLDRTGTTDFVRYKLNRAHSSKADLLELLKIILEEPDLKDFQQVIDHLNNGEEKTIILEDAQHLYLKKIGGFEAIQLLFDLISETSAKVFWVIEVTIYTYSYLQKTIRISSYFKNKIHLKGISEEQMIQLIMKRHRVSGYNLEFIHTNPSNKEAKKMNKMNEEEKQEYLKKIYFKSLNEFASSNISLALLFWLRSTIDVVENTIRIGMLSDMKFDFLSEMNEDSTFTLHALLLHDTLNVKEHASLFHQSEWQSKMTLMVLEDNGILKVEDERYKINRLLYRQVVNVLRQKNILH